MFKYWYMLNFAENIQTWHLQSNSVNKKLPQRIQQLSLLFLFIIVPQLLWFLFRPNCNFPCNISTETNDTL